VRRVVTSPGLVETSSGLVEIFPGLVSTRGGGVFTGIVTVYVKNDTLFNTSKASWLRRPHTEAGTVIFLRFSRPSRIVFERGSLHDKRGNEMSIDGKRHRREWKMFHSCS
jgi:hypothetical protein